VLYLLDEVLHGTNSAERRVATRAVLSHLLAARAIGAVSTHDLALAEDEPLASAARLVHFTETVHDAADGGARMTFDYRLRPGLATSTNALVLLRLMGLQP
jgi:DNA mismatch repair ATPase MutS